MSEKLKPCPFCGCSDVSMYTNGTDIDDYSYVVECDGCGCTLDTGFDSEERAIEEWNRRKEPKRKKGKWQRRKGSDCWECSQCHAVLENDDLGMHNFYFCYHCGANMMNKSGYMDIEEVHYE